MRIAIAILTLASTSGFAMDSSAFIAPALSNKPPILLAKANPRQLGNLLLELESNIKWEAVENRWRGRRDGWISDIQSTGDPGRIAELLIDLESNVKWEAVENKWRSRRDGWIRDCQAVANTKQLGRLILELESNIKWEAVENRWRARRNGWVQDVQNAQ